MKIIKSILLIVSLIILVVFAFSQVSGEAAHGIIYAEGDIEVSFDDDDWPFNEPNFLPGDKSRKSVTIRNNSSERQRVGLRLENGEGLRLPRYLKIAIYDSDTGRRLFRRSSIRSLYRSRREWRLFNLGAGEERRIDVEIEFKTRTRNRYQGESTAFDFTLGFVGRGRPPR